MGGGRRRREPLENFGESTTTPPISSVSRPVSGSGRSSGLPNMDGSGRRDAGRNGRAPARGGNSLLLKPSRASGAKKESWNTVESCHSAVRSVRRDATALELRDGFRLGAGAGAGCGPRAWALLLGTSNCSSATEGSWSTGQRR